MRRAAKLPNDELATSGSRVEERNPEANPDWSRMRGPEEVEEPFPGHIAALCEHEFPFVHALPLAGGRAICGSSMKHNWTRTMFVIGAVLDGIVAVIMLSPGLEALVWGFEVPVVDPAYRYAITFGAALMVGWTALLAWAALAPTERRGVALLTILVIAGLVLAEIVGMSSGFLPTAQVWGLIGLQILLITGFAAAYMLAPRSRNHPTHVGPS
ncbi:hypothetical protein ACFL6C_04940 [Myxococcota bacterium]